jgi:hypothetical protein
VYGGLRISREACRAFALSRSWENSARQFIAHVQKAAIGVCREPEEEIAMAAPSARLMST